MPLRTSDLEAHYTQELEYLAKLSAALLVSQEQKNHVSSFLFYLLKWSSLFDRFLKDSCFLTSVSQNECRRLF